MIKVLELFAGIGACSKALEKLGIEHEIVDAVEIDKYAIASFNAIHETNFEPQDITKWDKDIQIDLIMHGSPCQDFSLAGKQAGGDEGSGTRSSLMYETIRIVSKLRPKYVIWENVKNLLSKKHKHNFDAYIETMNILGYNSYYQVLNAKDYEIPQNRERVFTISIRKDVDDGSFTFPQKEELKLRLKDMLEEQVDKKYYLSDEKANTFKPNNKKQGVIGTLKLGNFEINNRVYGVDDISFTLRGKQPDPKILIHNMQQIVKVRKYPVDIEKLKTTLRIAKLNVDLNNKQIAERINVSQTQVDHYFRTDSSFAIPSPEIWYKLKEILNITTDYFDKSIMTFEEKDGVYEKANRIYDEEGLAPTLTQQEEKILVKNATKKGYLEATEGDGIDISSRMQYHRGNVQKGMIQTLDCQGGNSKGVVDSELRVRKLTPKECWRLMGFDDEDFEKAEKVNSNTQLYKQARKLNRRQCIRKNIRKFIKYGGVI